MRTAHLSAQDNKGDIHNPEKCIGFWGVFAGILREMTKKCMKNNMSFGVKYVSNTGGYDKDVIIEDVGNKDVKTHKQKEIRNCSTWNNFICV